jgi:predicted ABC-type ATPase
MIEAQTIEGRSAIVSYLNKDFTPADKDSAELVKVLFADGECRMGAKVPVVATRAAQTDVEWREAAIARLKAIYRYSDDEPRDDHGRWSSGGHLEKGEETADHFFNKEPGFDKNVDKYKTKGTWDKDRAAMHQQIIAKWLEGKEPSGSKPQAWILGGGTASGKSTASKELLGEDPKALNVDPDKLKLEIPEYAALKETDQDNAAPRVHEESSYLTKELMAAAANKRLDIIYDATTSGNGGPNMAKALAKDGYDVHVMFFDIPLSMARERQAIREATSTDPVSVGRHVKDEVIVENHQGAAAKFQVLKDMPEVKDARMYDNSQPKGMPPTLVYERSGTGGEKIHDADRWAKYVAKGKGHHD